MLLSDTFCCVCVHYQFFHKMYVLMSGFAKTKCIGKAIFVEIIITFIRPDDTAGRK